MTFTSTVVDPQIEHFRFEVVGDGGWRKEGKREARREWSGWEEAIGRVLRVEALEEVEGVVLRIEGVGEGKVELGLGVRHFSCH